MHRYRLSDEALDGPEIAVVGIGARLPGARDYFDYWRNLSQGVESVRRLSDEELRAAGVSEDELHDPNYVKACAVLDDLELFDAPFFGFSKREASVLDPQHRHFLEVCVEALQNAGVRPGVFDGSIGVFGGSGMNAYMPYNLFTNPELMRSMGLFLVRHTGNDKDFLTTRVSYCLNLQGPSVNIQTACSTSLVAIHAACQSLLSGECDVALAGGVTIELPHYRGYHYQEGEILSPDGHCRPFDAASRGTVFGSGAGVVVLRRLKDAVENGDFIHALVLGSAINNDGNRKVGYLAPSVEGQAECVVEALQVAGLTAREISYIECHGTGTPIGDPIEVGALQQAFRRSTKDKQFCAIGSVKSNIGHLDTAAGVASFIKVTEMLQHEQIVPTLHFEAPNPQIEFSSSPFFVAGESKPWPRTDVPRRAGISSLGVGGTNAHIIVEEAPKRDPLLLDGPQFLVLSARSKGSVDAYSQRLARHFDESSGVSLADVSSTLFHGRDAYPQRRVLAVENLADAGRLLTQNEAGRVFDLTATKDDLPVVFLFPGGGAQYANMARVLYETEPLFRAELTRCFTVLERQEGLRLEPIMFPKAGDGADPAELERPSLALPALFAIELAYARLLASWGITPAAMLGHSLGEYTAAHLAGVLALEAALGIVCCRGRLFETVERGGMLSVPLSQAELEPLLGDRLSVAVVNAPQMSVVSGDNAALDALAATLAARDIEARRLMIDVPAHSPLLEPILDEFREYLRTIEFGTPRVPYVSNRTADFVRAEELNAEYFVQHLRHTVRFSEGLSALLERHPDAILVEVGPGQVLTSLVRQHPARPKEMPVVPMSPHVKETIGDALHAVTSIGRILAHGARFDADALSKRLPRSIVPLPPVPFEHERYWVEPGKGYFQAAEAGASSEREHDIARWFYTRVFREEPAAPSNIEPGERWLVLVDSGPLAEALQLELKARRVEPIIVVPGDKTERLSPARYTIELGEQQAYDDLIQQIVADGSMPARFVHALCLGRSLLDPAARANDSSLNRAFFSLLHLAQILGQEELGSGIELVIAVSRAFDVVGTDALRPLHALTQGPALVVPKEIPEIRARIVDLLDPEDVNALARDLVHEASAPSLHPVVAVRGARRYVQVSERSELGPARSNGLPEHPVILFTGGLGGISRTLAGHFAARLGARLVLVSRSALPPPDAWADYRRKLEPHDPRGDQFDWLLAEQAAGHEVLVVPGDVTRVDDMQRVVATVRERFGHVDMLVHAAGMVHDEPLALKDREGALEVLAPKVHGTEVVLAALAEEPLRVALLIGSSSAVLGPPGQIDYVAANAFVNAQAERLRHSLPATRVVALNFGVWSETGMAVNAKLGKLPVPIGEPVEHPLLRRESQIADAFVFQAIYAPEGLWVLDEHRIRGGSSVLPGTAFVEIARAAGTRALGLAPDDAVEISDLMLISPLELPGDAARHVSIQVEPAQPDSRAGSGRAVEVTLSSRGATDDAAVEHARARVSRGSGSVPPPLPVADLWARCRLRSLEFEEGQQSLPQDEHLAFGGHWKVVRRAGFGDGEAIASLVMPERFRADLERMALNPALLDMASGFAFSLADPAGTQDRVRVPLSYQRAQFIAPLGAEIVSFVRLRSVNEREGIAVFDFDVADPSGRVLLSVTGYTTKSVVWGGAARKAGKDQEPTVFDRWLRQGITNQEGIEIVERVLASDSPACLTATPTSLFAMLEELRPKAVSKPETGAPPSVAAPASEDAPRDEVERQLASMWTSLLGVDSVGIRDDFFELGGHSLIAVRLFSRIKKVYDVDLSLAVLFQAPTIEACAEIIRKELGVHFAPEPRLKGEASTTPGANGTPAVAKPSRNFQALVQIQKGDGRTPLFMVHGAGGNVLNFRDLAVGLGKDQTFYGIQARGVDGGPTSSTIEEMAELYLEELLAVVPDGPYLIGGYSGGGVVAFEMAQRLAAMRKRVDLLTFLDTFHPGTKPKTYTFRQRLEQLVKGGALFATKRATGVVTRHWDELSVELKTRLFLSQGLPLPLELRNIQMTRAFYSAADLYHPAPYYGNVLLFRARMVAEVYDHVGPKLGWDDLIPNMEIIEVPGGHDSLVLEPNVQVLITNLKRRIQQVAAERS